MSPTTPYRPRLIDSVLADSFEVFAAVMVVGATAVGKTTSAARLVAQVDRLDVPDVAASYRADPDAALRRAVKPLLLDEWQEVPEVLAAVKRAGDRDPAPGQFVLTGSIRATTQLATWAGTGRVVRLAMHPLAEREVSGNVHRHDLINDLTTRWLDAIIATLPTTDLDGYLTLALRGSFPDLAFAQRTQRQRRLWLGSYLEVLDVVPVWTSNRLKRLTKSGKRYLVDTALAAAAAGVDLEVIVHDSDLRGGWFDAFAAMQVRAELAAAAPGRRVHHLRVEGGRREVDLVVDLGRGRLFAFEFKAGSAPTRHDARHLIWLRNELGAQFVGGVVLHTGQVGRLPGS